MKPKYPTAPRLTRAQFRRLYAELPEEAMDAIDAVIRAFKKGGKQ